MSAQLDPQVSSSRKPSALFQKVKGSLSLNSQQLLQKAVGKPVAAPDLTSSVTPATQSTSVAPVVEDIVTSQAVQPVVDNQTHIQNAVPQTVAEPEQPAEEVIAQAVPQVIDEATDTLNPPDVVGGGTAKEAPNIAITVERPAVDVVPGMQQVELEKSHELPPEVEGFLQAVEDHQDQIPQEIVISNPQTGQSLPRVMAQPVIVLPITPEIEETGKKQPPNFSVRWLVEWSWKLMKAFSGKVVYRKASN